jgi:hypothetical protein
MKLRYKSDDRLDYVLRQAYRSRPVLPGGSRWTQDVMRQIRSLPSTAAAAGGPWLFGALVWRLAPATGVLALIVLTVLMNFTLIADADLFQLFYAETQMLSLVSF